SSGPGVVHIRGCATGATRRGTGRAAVRPTPIAARSYDAPRCGRNIRASPRSRACARKSAGSFAASCDKSRETDSLGKVQAFVQPAKWSAAKAAINAKPRAVGKPEIPKLLDFGAFYVAINLEPCNAREPRDGFEDPLAFHGWSDMGRGSETTE